MKKYLILCFVLASTVLSQGILANGWGGSKLHKEVDLELSTANISKFSVDAAAGDLDIICQQGLSQITVVAKVYGEELDDTEYQLTLERDGDQAVLIARFTDNSYNNERIDLEILMPNSLTLTVDDRSGDVLIEGAHNGLILNDRSGDIELSDIAGEISIVDRSGDLVAKDLRGDVTVYDRSGDILLKEVDGNIDIEDSSGDIRAKNVTGVVTVEDSSGDININNAGDFILENDGSGEVYLKNIKANMK
jgi:hypothetical protein